MVLRAQFFKTNTVQDQARLGQDQDLKNGLKTDLKTKTGLNDYITGFIVSYWRQYFADGMIKILLRQSWNILDKYTCAM